MKALINDGGQAFPRTGFVSEIETNEQLIAQFENKPQEGMTLRDYFAGQALAGYTSDAKSRALLCSEVAEHAYDYADAMLAKRKEDDK